MKMDFVNVNMLLVVLVVVVGLPFGNASVKEAYYDCQLRQIALDYTHEVILSPNKGWSSLRSLNAVSLVMEGLNSNECNITGPTMPTKSTSSHHNRDHQRDRMGDTATSVTIYVATAGNDSGAGTIDAPLRTVPGAQHWIRSKYPNVPQRPAINVVISGGDYFYGSAPADHVVRSTRYSNTSIARFTELDSGASADSPITYTSAPNASVRFIGGMSLAKLTWAPVAGSSAGVMKATVPDNVAIDLQDQMFVSTTDGNYEPVIRARTPNGKPWLPQDGYNLTVLQSTGQLPKSPVYQSCVKAPPSPPQPNLPPRPVAPAAGACVAAPGITLLTGYPNIPGVYINSTTAPSAAACMALCKASPCCRGFTWHDNTTGSFFEDCFFLTDQHVDTWNTAHHLDGHYSGLCDHSDIHPAPTCDSGVSPHACVPANVVCDATNETQVMGSLGVSTVAGKTIGGDGVVRVTQCFEHLLDLANDWPKWNSESYGLSAPCDENDPTSCVSTLDTTYNFPLWYGPWASGILLDIAQDAGAGVDMSKYHWTDASQVVVHALADGAWGGVQFKVEVAANVPGTNNASLNFTYGGFQQARGATLRQNNKFYMEGSLEFLDAPGEWHFDASTHELYMTPPVGVASLMDVEVVLTQTDTLFEFVGSSSDAGSRVENVVLTNLTFSHTSSQFFRPHEETSGGDYATHRSGAIKVENATGLTFVGNEFLYLGGNAVFLSNSVRNTTVTANLFRWLGTSGVTVMGKTGIAMMDGRDGEALVEKHGAQADNGVRLPRDNLVSHNIFVDFGVWDKQCACYHKALAPGNMFLNNICFNSSRHGVNFQDGMGGKGVAEGNVMFNLNRETRDTTSFNSWNRRNYITSDETDPAVGILVPQHKNEWRRNLVLSRNFYGVDDGNGNGLRNDDGASNYNHSGNVLIGGSNVQFNGGTQIWVYNNLLISSGWHLGPTPDVAGMYNNTFVDTRQGLGGSVEGFWNVSGRAGVKPGIYRGDYQLGVFNSTGQGGGGKPGAFFSSFTLEEFQQHTGQEMHTKLVVNTNGEYSSEVILAQARAMLWMGQEEV